MMLRPKTKRRLLILLTIATVSVGLLGAVYGVARHRRNIALSKLRGEAMMAYQSGEFEKSAALLEEYRDKANNQELDADAQLVYARSRMNVPLPQQQHVHDAIHAFELYLERMNPGDEGAQQDLLGLYLQGGYNVEAVRVADQLLEKNPRDLVAMERKAAALERQHKTSEALAVTMKLNEIDPLNIRVQVRTLSLMKQGGANGLEMIARAQTLLKAHENDPRFELLLARACFEARQMDECLKWLRLAATQSPPDGDLVVDLVSAMDSIGLYREATSYLTNAADAIATDRVQRLYAQRLWQDEKLSELQTRVKYQDPKSPGSDGVLIGYHALALYADGKNDAAAALVQLLHQRQDAPSQAWSESLSTIYAKPPLNPRERLSRLQRAAARDSVNPVLRSILASAWLEAGEYELAISQCNQYAELAPGWGLPYIQMAQAMLAEGRNPQDAASVAEKAYSRAPGRLDSESVLAKARFAVAKELGGPSDYEALLPLLEDLQKNWHDQRTLPLYVTALARCGRRDQAESVVNAALQADPPLTSVALISLADAAESEKLKSAAQVRERAAGLYHSTPELVLAQAQAMLNDGDEAHGLELINSAAQGHETDLAWRRVIAIYLDLAGSPAAGHAWALLIDQAPNDLEIQELAIRSRSRFADRPMWSKAIDRVRELTGDGAVVWRVERARWLLTGDGGEKDKAEAIHLLTDVTRAAPGLAEPHYLLGMALEKAGNLPASITELTSAADLRPGDPVVTRELVHLLDTNHRANDAKLYLQQLSEKPTLSTEARLWVARTLADRRDIDAAIRMLTRSDNADSSVERDRLLATLYRRAGKWDEAARIYSRLLDATPGDPNAYADGAAFYVARHDLAMANKFMAKLNSVPLKPGELEVYRGQFAERKGDIDGALVQFQQATQKAPKSVAYWRGLIVFELAHRRFADARDSASAAIAKVGEQTRLTAYRDRAAALAALKDASSLDPLIEAICRNPSDPAVVEMLGVISADRSANLTASSVAANAQAVADRHPDSRTLRRQAVTLLIAAGLRDAALDSARQMAIASDDADAQRELALLYCDAGQWNDAERTALLWRQLAEDPVWPDMLLARIYLGMPKKNASAALSYLVSYLPAEQPEQSPAVLQMYTEALVRLNRGSEAASLLSPLTGSSAEWRTHWLNLAAAQPDAAAASAWISKVAPQVPTDSSVEQIALADAWYHVATQFDANELLDRAYSPLEPLLQNADASVQCWQLAAMINLARGNYDLAEKQARKVLDLQPHSPDAMNNLAYVLCMQANPQTMPQARDLASKAVALAPNSANFYDTLARIHSRLGDNKAAIQTFKVALTKDSQSLEAMIGLADLLSKTPSTRDQARDMVNQIDRILSSNPRISATLRKQFQSTRAALVGSF